jgi:hypothetical protein
MWETMHLPLMIDMVAIAKFSQKVDPVVFQMTNSIRFMVNHNFKVSSSARRVSAVNAICTFTGIFNKIYFA